MQNQVFAHRSSGFGVYRQRHVVPEWMDDPNLDSKLHQEALYGLNRINWLSFTARQVADELARCCRLRKLNSVRLLDIACGDGIVANQVAGILIRKGLSVQMTGWDISPTAVQFSRSTEHSRFEVQDIFAEVQTGDELVEAPFDFAYSTLFMHHLSDEQAIILLRRMRKLCKHGSIISDLKRSQLGWWLAYITCRILTRSPVVHFDGPQSVRAAYTTHEALRLARESGWVNLHFRRQWPQRFMMTGTW